MKNSEIILIGAGGHARSCIDVIEQHGVHQIAGLVGTKEEYGSHRFGYSIIGNDQDIPDLAQKYKHALVAVGQIGSPDIRIEFYQAGNKHGLIFAVIISPQAYVSSHSTIGNGTVVMHGAIINAGARIGENCIINSNALIEHDVVVGDHCHVSTGATLNGGVRVDTGSFIGSGSVVREAVVVGPRAFISMGAKVKNDVAANQRV